MKKSKIVILIGLLTIMTTVTIVKPTELNSKNKFYSVNSLIESFNNNLLRVQDDRFNNIDTQTLYDCISKRKRLSYSGNNYDKVELKENIKLSDDQKETIIDEYIDKASKINNYKLSDEIIPFRFKGYGITYIYDYTNGKSSVIDKIKIPIILDAIVIKEDGSYVFDLFWFNELNSDNSNHEVTNEVIN